MINEVDEAVRSLVKSEVVNGADVEVVFDAPTRDWASRRNKPTIDMYLYDIREDTRRRSAGMIERRNERGIVEERQGLPRFFKLAYLITAWTQRAEDEHRLLSAVLACFLQYDVMPTSMLPPAPRRRGLSARYPDRLPALRGPAGVRRVVIPRGGPQALGRSGDHPRHTAQAAVRDRSGGHGTDATANRRAGHLRGRRRGPATFEILSPCRSSRPPAPRNPSSAAGLASPPAVRIRERPDGRRLDERRSGDPDWCQRRISQVGEAVGGLPAGSGRHRRVAGQGADRPPAPGRPVPGGSVPRPVRL